MRTLREYGDDTCTLSECAESIECDPTYECLQREKCLKRKLGQVKCQLDPHDALLLKLDSLRMQLQCKSRKTMTSTQHHKWLQVKDAIDKLTCQIKDARKGMSFKTEKVRAQREIDILIKEIHCKSRNLEIAAQRLRDQTRIESEQILQREEYRDKQIMKMVKGREDLESQRKALEFETFRKLKQAEKALSSPRTRVLR